LPSQLVDVRLQIGSFSVRIEARDETASGTGRRLLQYLAPGPAGPGADVGRCELETVASLPDPPSGVPVAARYEDFDLTLWRDGDGLFLRSRLVGVTVAPRRGEAHAALLAEASASGDTFAVLMLAVCALLRPHGLLPLHAAGLVHAGEGVLVSAPSGFGKSTLTLALVREGWGFLSDDALLLEETASGIEALPFRRTFGLLPETMAWLPVPSEGWPRHPADGQKVAVPMADLLPAQAADRCRPGVLLFPNIAEASESRLLPLRPAEAFTALLRQSGLITLDPGWAREHVAALGRLVGQARSYRLMAGRDVLEAPSAVSQLLASAVHPLASVA
jgi:hypothetical protein